MNLPEHSLILRIPEPQISARVKELGAEIAPKYIGEELVLVAALIGAQKFAIELGQVLEEHGVLAQSDYIVIDSGYDESLRPVRKPKVLAGPKKPMKGRKVLLVEDIVDTGHTLATGLASLRKLRPLSLESVSLLSKPSRRQIDIEADYTGFEIENYFAVGEYLDWDEFYRFLRGIWEVKFPEN